MPFRVIEFDGVKVITHSYGERKCEFCGRTAYYPCDYPTGKDKTCDKAICKICKVAVGKDLDYCPSHVAKRKRKINEKFK